MSQMLHDLGWCDLKDRLRDLRLALLYKIVTGHVAINPDQIGLVAADNRTRANHRYKFRAIGAPSTGLRYSFAVRTVSDWNQLPGSRRRPRLHDPRPRLSFLSSSRLETKTLVSRTISLEYTAGRLCLPPSYTDHAT